MKRRVRFDNEERRAYIVQRITARRYRRFAETLDDGIARSFFPWAKLSIMQTAALWEIGLTNVYRSRVCAGTVLTPSWHITVLSWARHNSYIPGGLAHAIQGYRRNFSAVASTERVYFIYFFHFYLCNLPMSIIFDHTKKPYRWIISRASNYIQKECRYWMDFRSKYSQQFAPRIDYEELTSARYVHGKTMSGVAIENNKNGKKWKAPRGLTPHTFPMLSIITCNIGCIERRGSHWNAMLSYDECILHAAKALLSPQSKFKFLMNRCWKRNVFSPFSFQSVCSTMKIQLQACAYLCVKLQVWTLTK